jgi:hypothetical protein
MSRLPPSTLELLALTACDDGAIADVSVEKDPDDPTMVRIGTMTKKTALDSMNWRGFQSSQL